ncbi:MAG: MBL fold metallo-hydrolase [Alphaproteobacteria bacterium]|nr:MBL fold metallo-hydrolase [Alphaproteobacteria bacterium]
MPTVHFLNVNSGDCSIIQHGKGNVSVIDICGGNSEEEANKYVQASGLLSSILGAERYGSSLAEKGVKGNFKMKDHLANPIDYLKKIGVKSIFRFILTHPDMDHMDGLKKLKDEIGISNFWDAGVSKDKPSFEGTRYKEEDWDQYKKMGRGEGVVSAIHHLAGSKFKYANRNDDDSVGGDCLSILAPNKELVDAATGNEDPNDASYVILYRSAGGRILFPGDAHDATWEYVMANYEADVENCSILIAPHHGRHSDRSFDFLDCIEPKLTLLGNAESDNLAYEEWSNRGLAYITSNQAGNIVLATEDGFINVFIENEAFAKASGKDCSVKNAQGYILWDTIKATAEGKQASGSGSVVLSQSAARTVSR